MCTLSRCKSTLTRKAKLLRMTSHWGNHCTKYHRNTISHFHLIAHHVSGGGNFSQGIIFCDTQHILANF